ncbi:MAG: hypothetical protein K2R93_15840 [Gemmatimonadaceae bacterium]|nr:hypothetical protein [Gemmatimonadaceae bacterium]
MTAPAVAPALITEHSTTRRRARTLHDRATIWLSVVLLTTLLGFQRTITSRLGTLDVAHAVHGVASLGWLVVLIVQAELIRRRRRESHRQLALWGVLFAMAMTVTALPMLQVTGARAVADPRGGQIGWFLLIMDSGLLLLFLSLFATAVANVRRPAIHARAMAATSLIGLAPGLGRWCMRLFQVDPIAGSYFALAAGAVWLGCLIWSDRRAGVRDRVYPAMLVATLFVMGLSQPIAQRFTHVPVAVSSRP